MNESDAETMRPEDAHFLAKGSVDPLALPNSGGIGGMGGIWPPNAVAGAVLTDVDTAIAAEVETVATRNEYALRRQRRALVRRLIDFVRVEQLKLAGPNDHTSAEELAHDAIMKALDAYFEGRPKAAVDTFSAALDTLEKMRVAS